MLSTARRRPLWKKEVREVDSEGNTLMTVPYIKELCKEQKLYQTPSLNDRLYLHFKGFKTIQNLEVYTGLRSLWLEGNGIDKIENLDSCIELRCLFLQQNCVEKIENLDSLINLDTLNLSNNLLKSISGLSNIPLKTLNVPHNFLKTADDIREIQQCPTLSIVDLSYNKIDDPAIVEIFENMPNLAVLNLMNNPVKSLIKDYRRTLICKIPSLTYLDDRPVFDNERLAVEAWARGGPDAEQEERARQRQEERDRHNRSFEALRRLQEENRARRLASQGGVEEEPTFPEPLERFRQEQLDKIKEIDDNEEGNAGIVASAIESGEEEPAVAKSAEVDVIKVKTPMKVSDSIIDDMEIDVDEELPPVRQTTSLTTSGTKLEVEGLDEKSTSEKEDDDDDDDDELGFVTPDEEIEKPKLLIEEITEEEFEKESLAKPEQPQSFLDHLTSDRLTVPELEDASKEVEEMRERRKLAQSVQQDDTSYNNVKEVKESSYKVVPDSDDEDDEIEPLLIESPAQLLSQKKNTAFATLSDKSPLNSTLNEKDAKELKQEEQFEDQFSTLESKSEHPNVDVRDISLLNEGGEREAGRILTAKDFLQRKSD